MLFTSRWCWQRDVPPRCPRRSSKVIIRNSTSRGGRDRLEELWWEKLAMKEAFRRHKRLLHSSSLALSVPAVTLADLSNNPLCCRCHTLCFEPRTQTGVRVRRRMLVSSHLASLYPLFFFFFSLTHVCRLRTSLSDGYPVSLLISRDVRRDERRRKISEMSSLMSNTKCEPSLFLTPPSRPALSCLAAVTLAVLLAATPCQVEFRDSDTVSSNPSSGLSVSRREKNSEGDGRKRWERQAERREATDHENLGARSKEDFALLQYS